jgi:hypothetical protein
VSDDATTGASAELHRAVRAEIAAMGPANEGRFERLALAIARFQVDRVAPLARLCRARGVDVRAIDSIDDLPAIPSDVLRLKRVAAHSSIEDIRVFRTSGTTSGARGQHFFRDLGTYEEAAMAFAAKMLWPDGAPDRVIALAPPSARVADSSLGFMIDLFASRLGAPISHHVDLDAGLDVAGVERAVGEAREAGARVLVAGTAFAYVFLLDALGAGALALPPASTLMLTGGFKGRSREVPEAELRAALALRLGLEPRRIVGEYGMTELSSQLYEGRLARIGDAYRAPPWVRVTAVDPLSLRPVPPGDVGIARIVDLANVDSAVAIQTMDRVRVSAHGVELLGRLPGATPRGCSIAIDELLGRAATSP